MGEFFELSSGITGGEIFQVKGDLHVKSCRMRFSVLNRATTDHRWGFSLFLTCPVGGIICGREVATLCLGSTTGWEFFVPSTVREEARV